MASNKNRPFNVPTVPVRIPEFMKPRIVRTCQTFLHHKFVYLCGPSSSEKEMEIYTEKFTNIGHVVISSNGGSDIDLRKAKIDLCDAIAVFGKTNLEDINNEEILHAHSRGIQVIYYGTQN